MPVTRGAGAVPPVVLITVGPPPSLVLLWGLVLLRSYGNRLRYLRNLHIGMGGPYVGPRSGRASVR